jgi:hypothetical protein
MLPLRGISSVGRALAWHARGQEFDSPMLHHSHSIVMLAKLVSVTYAFLFNCLQ